MRQFSFDGYLKQYLRRLSRQKRFSVYRLALEADKTNPRLREPLVLYAVLREKVEVLRSANVGSWLECDVLEYTPSEVMSMLQSASEHLPENYTKVYRSYCAKVNRQKTDNETKGLCRERTWELMQTAGLSCYRMYKALGLDSSNVTAYLKHGDVSKVSLDTARRLYEFAKETCV